MSTMRTWTHGNSLVVEDPGEYSYIRHRGWGTALGYALPRDDEDPQNLSLRSCHVPITTPALVDNEVPSVTKIYMPYETSSDMYIAQVVLWDDNSIVYTWNRDPSDEGLLARGTHLEVDASNQLSLGRSHRVVTALNVAILVQLYVTSAPGDSPGDEPPLDPWILTVGAVGIDWLYPVQPTRYTEKVDLVLESAAQGHHR
jgi:hypothetical protein